MEEQNLRQVNNALALTRQLIPLVEEAEGQFKSARNWGFLDMFMDGSGGLLSGLIKHAKLSNAQQNMNKIQYLMGQLQAELQRIVVPTDYAMSIGGFATFADFFLDGTIVDVYMQYKIMSSLKQVQDLKAKLYLLQDRLVEFSSRY
ncbi:MAG: hypothetical protein K5839_07245 [Treponemataceae bacterium]|nr:hypothetical protein [Treponemataceae bacterium]